MPYLGGWDGHQILGLRAMTAMVMTAMANSQTFL
jgi:hypothetical protein